MLKKMVLYFSNIHKMVYINKMRFFLCFIGVFISVGLYSVGLIAAESYKKDKLYAIEEADGNSVSIRVEKAGDAALDDMYGVQPIIDVTRSWHKYLGNRKLTNGGSLDIKVYCHGVTDLSVVTPYFLSNKEYLVSPTKIINGRYINEADDFEKNRVVVIDEITSLLLFESVDSIGKKISFKDGPWGVISFAVKDRKEYSIVGIVQSTYEQKKQYVELLSALEKKKTNEDLPLCIGNIYVPVFAISEDEIFQPEERQNYYTYKADKDNSEKIQKTFQKTLSGGSSLFSSVNSKDLSRKRIMLEIRNMSALINLGMVVLCLLCSINMTSIVMFSIKERIPEMAVRRALGATKLEILFQVFFEMSIISFMASFFAVVVSYLGMRCYSSLALKHYGIWFLVSIDLHKLLLPLLLGMLTSILSSLIPAIYASKTSITNALKFE